MSSKQPIRLVIVDDDPAYGKCLARVLDSLGDFRVCDHFRNPVTFLTRLPELEYDLVFLDVEMPKISGVECVREIKSFKPETRVIMFSVHDDDEYVLTAFQNGADGYLLKDSSPSQLLEAIEDTLSGGATMSPSVARKVVQTLKSGAQGSQEDAGDLAVRRYQLTSREREVLEQLAEGYSYAVIGTRLTISKETVKFHIKNIYEKMNAANRTEAVSRFLRP